MPHDHANTADLACEVCGRLPEPRKGRLTTASIIAMLPVELAVHAAVVSSDLSLVAKVLVLTVTATTLVIWVAEPSVMRVLRRWLHAPILRERRRLDSAGALWRLRTTVDDTPGALEAITMQLALLEGNILSVQVQPGSDGAIDEFVVDVPERITARDLVEAVEDGGGRDPQVWPTTALALIDGPTKALSAAVRVAGAPQDLPDAVADLLGAEVVDGGPGAPKSYLSGDAARLKVHSRWHGAVVLARPGQPFTAAESARAHRLAELAEVVEGASVRPGEASTASSRDR
ncbi:amino acid-binding protein [Georgenia sp. EYE_87]|uniref:amino acid-binding protein n=1 Tax=Georgenia sp. EYE_87 TaxID=2853448 RepID=UPI002003D1D9|nr:amino acid-binding protein [Georgenia sp. EYE_87]MCK6210288.1 amino acid-binding protein [Georgenia sp. EYE_87]